MFRRGSSSPAEEDLEGVYSPPGQNGNASAKRRRRSSQQQDHSQRHGAAGASVSRLATQEGMPGRRPAGQRGRNRDEPPYFGREDSRFYNELVDKYKQKLRKAEEQMGPVMDPGVDMDSLAGSVARQMLSSNFEKPNQPVARQKLCENVTAQYKDLKSVKKLPSLAIAMAQYKMITTMAIEMVEYERHGQAAGPGRPRAGEEGSGTKWYVLRSAVPAKVRDECVREDKAEKAKEYSALGLTMFVLCLIHLSPNKQMKEADLLKELVKLGVCPEENQKPPEELQRMVDRRYCKRSDKRGQGETEGGQSNRVYEWAENAMDLIKERDVKAYIDKMVKQQEVIDLIDDDDD